MESYRKFIGISKISAYGALKFLSAISNMRPGFCTFIQNNQKVLHAQGFRQTHRYYPADDEICPRCERQVPAVSTASPWNQRNSFWISVSSATEYPSFWQMDSICLFGIPVFGLFEFKISDIWQQLGYRTKLRTTGLMALPLVSHLPMLLSHPILLRMQASRCAAHPVSFPNL